MLLLLSLQLLLHALSYALACAAFSARIMSTNCSKHTSASWGPGEASGWYWMVMAFFSLNTMPVGGAGAGRKAGQESGVVA